VQFVLRLDEAVVLLLELRLQRRNLRLQLVVVGQKLLPDPGGQLQVFFFLQNTPRNIKNLSKATKTKQKFPNQPQDGASGKAVEKLQAVDEVLSGGDLPLATSSGRNMNFKFSEQLTLELQNV